MAVNVILRCWRDSSIATDIATQCFSHSTLHSLGSLCFSVVLIGKKGIVGRGDPGRGAHSKLLLLQNSDRSASTFITVSSRSKGLRKLDGFA